MNPKLEQHLVGIRRRTSNAWHPAPFAPMSIAEARVAYNDGTHELCQGADEHRFYLYCIPRFTPVDRSEKHRIPNP